MTRGSTTLYLGYGAVAVSIIIGIVVYISQKTSLTNGSRRQSLTYDTQPHAHTPTRDMSSKLINPFLIAKHNTPDQTTVPDSLTAAPETAIFPGAEIHPSADEIMANQSSAIELKILLEKLQAIDAPEPSLETIQSLWRLAGDTKAYDKVIQVLQQMTEHKDTRIAEYAGHVVADLEKVRDRKVDEIDQLVLDLYVQADPQTSHAVNRSYDVQVEEQAQVLHSGSRTRMVNTVTADRLVYLCQYAESEKMRERAYHALEGNRLPQTIDLLEQRFSALDGDARMNAVQTLYHFAADGIERKRAMLLLQSAALDSDLNIAGYAQKALQYLQGSAAEDAGWDISADSEYVPRNNKSVLDE